MNGRKSISSFAYKMHVNGFTDLWYAHPGSGNFNWPERWHVGHWTGPDNDLICLKLCATGEEAEKWLSPGGSDPWDALNKAIEKLRCLKQRQS